MDIHHRRGQRTFWVRYTCFLICWIVVFFVLYIVAVPKMLLGEFFFGGFAPVYNVRLAEFFFEEAIRYDGKNGLPPPYAYHQLSRTAFIAGDLDTALALIAKELRYYPHHYHTYYIQGLTLGYMNGRERDAIRSFEMFLMYEPQSWAARNDAAWLAFRIGDINKALELIEPSVRQFAQNPWILNTYGVLLMNSGRNDEALEVLNKAFAIASGMTPEDWGRAYPGNSPTIYPIGLARMRAVIEKNIQLLKG